MRPFPVLFLTSLLFGPVALRIEILNCTCYPQENGYRVIGGKKITNQNAFPWQVSIQKKRFWYWPPFTDSMRIDLHFCGGVIVNKLYVLSAVHCYRENKTDNWDDFAVGYGYNDLLKMFSALPRGSYREIANVIWPNHTEPRRTPPDVALVQLKTPFKWSSSAQPACLATAEFVPNYGGQLMVTGWGLAEAPLKVTKTGYLLNHPESPKDLKVAYVQDHTIIKPNKPPTQLIRVYNRTEHKLENGTVVEFNDLCGPLHQINEHGQATVIGILSGGISGSHTTNETYLDCSGMVTYSRISKYLPWIQSIVGDRPGQHYCAIHYCTDKFCV